MNLPEPHPRPTCPVCHEPAEKVSYVPWPPDRGTSTLHPCGHEVQVRYTEAGDLVCDKPLPERPRR